MLVVEERKLRKKRQKIQMGEAGGVWFQMKSEINLEMLKTLLLLHDSREVINRRFKSERI